MAVNSRIIRKPLINTFFGQNSELLNVEVGGTYSAL
jgi:hypothetical protein